MPVPTNYDFCGWATRNDLRCADGLTIRKDAFKENDGMTVPMVWNHDHNDPSNVLGHAYLENRPEGVYTYGTFNDTEAGQDARILVNHGDVNSLSIWANRLQKNGSDVLHGMIREVSLVLAGANPGAYIETVVAHGDDSGESAIIYSGDELELHHAEEEKEKDMKEEEIRHAGEEAEAPAEEKPETNERTVKDVFDEFTDEQKKVVYALIAAAVEEAESGDEDEEEDEESEEKEEDKTVKHNVFDNETKPETEVLSHSEMEAIMTESKRNGSLKDTVLQHGITNIGNLFPEVRPASNVPETLSRRMDWVDTVINGVHKTPFSRVKSWYVDITADTARAKGYVKGRQKVEEVIAALKRSTLPTTVYKLQKLDRDDVIDITDFDVVAWIKKEMWTMLDEEIARAILVGDGRSSDHNDKINELSIRPIWKDDDVYTIKQRVTYGNNPTADDKAKAFIQAAVRSRKNYEGAGNPVLFTTEDVLTDCLLMEDKQGRVIYDTMDKLTTALRVSKIVTSPVLENLTRTFTENNESVTTALLGIIVNLADYNVGADKGGEVNLFDDFDINYNKQEYLIETRCSGALVKPHSAIALETVVNPT